MTSAEGDSQSPAGREELPGSRAGRMSWPGLPSLTVRQPGNDRVGATGFEPVTSSASRKRSSPELSAPILMSCEATTGIEPV